MRYVLSGLVGFFVTLVISLPVQHLMQIKEARASSLISLKTKPINGRSWLQGRSDLVIDVPPLPLSELDPKEPRIKFLPQYPFEAAEMQMEGYVVMSFNVGPDGSVQKLKIVESVPSQVFDKAARRAVTRWNFRPPTLAKDASVGTEGTEQKLRLNFNLKKALASEYSTIPNL